MEDSEDIGDEKLPNGFNATQSSFKRSFKGHKQRNESLFKLPRQSFKEILIKSMPKALYNPSPSSKPKSPIEHIFDQQDKHE